jgi:hypothetical protein
MAKNFEKLIFGGLHEKHAVQREVRASTSHSLVGLHGLLREQLQFLLF